MNLTIIAAVSENNIIGRGGKIPWYIPEDLRRFKELTTGNVVIMGRETYESIGNALPNRRNIVMSNSVGYFSGAQVVRNINDVFGTVNNEKSYVIGGEKIYEMFLPYADRIELTKVHRTFDGDRFFPKVDWDDWNLINEESKISKRGLPYSFLSYERKNLNP